MTGNGILGMGLLSADRQKADFKILAFTEEFGLYMANSISCFLPFGFVLK